LCIICLIGFLILHFSHFFTFQTIVCDVDGRSCPTFIQAELDELKGTSVFKSTYLEKIIKINHVLPSFAQPQVRRVLPHTLQVHFQRLPEVYRLSSTLLSDGGSSSVVDQAGIVTQVVTASEAGALTTVLAPKSFLDPLQVNTQVDLKIHQALLEIFAAQHLYNFSYGSIEVKTADEVHITLTNHKLVIVPTAETASALEKLSQVLKTVDFTRLPESITVIDVRFKYPVLKTHLE
jgi:hypothetical protein